MNSTTSTTGWHLLFPLVDKINNWFLDASKLILFVWVEKIIVWLKICNSTNSHFPSLVNVYFFELFLPPKWMFSITNFKCSWMASVPGQQGISTGQWNISNNVQWSNNTYIHDSIDSDFFHNRPTRFNKEHSGSLLRIV